MYKTLVVFAHAGCFAYLEVSQSPSELGRQRTADPRTRHGAETGARLSSHDLGDLPRAEMSSQAVAPAALPLAARLLGGECCLSGTSSC